MVHTTTSIAWGLFEVLNSGTLMLIYYIKAIITMLKKCVDNFSDPNKQVSIYFVKMNESETKHAQIILL